MAGPKKSVALSGVSVAETSICSIDPDEGVLMYRGYDIAGLAEHASYEEVAYLLLEGDLPSGDELDAFKEQLAGARELPRAVTTIIDGNAMDALADGDDADGRLGALLLRPGRGRDRPRERAPQGRRADRAAADDRRALRAAPPRRAGGRSRTRRSTTPRTS